MSDIGGHTTLDDSKTTVSYTQVKTYLECPFRYKLLYVDHIERSEDNIIFAYGRAVHTGLQKLWEVDCSEAQKIYLQQLEDDFSKLGVPITDQADKGLHLIFEMYKTGYSEYKCLGIEELLLEPFYDNVSFKGLIDIVLEIPQEDGSTRIKLIDFKTTEKGWGWYKKHDFTTHMQLLLYKWFYSQKHNIPMKQIDLEFVLLNGASRTVEFFNLAHTDQDIQIAWQATFKVLNNIYNKQEFKKNVDSCNYCQFNDRSEICDKQTDILLKPSKSKMKSKQNAFYSDKKLLNKKINL